MLQSTTHRLTNKFLMKSSKIKKKKASVFLRRMTRRKLEPEKFKLLQSKQLFPVLKELLKRTALGKRRARGKVSQIARFNLPSNSQLNQLKQRPHWTRNSNQIGSCHRSDRSMNCLRMIKNPRILTKRWLLGKITKQTKTLLEPFKQLKKHEKMTTTLTK